MKALELFHMLGDVGVYNRESLSKYKVVTKDGRSFTGIWIDHDKKQIIMVQPDTKVENRVDT